MKTTILAILMIGIFSLSFGKDRKENAEKANKNQNTICSSIEYPTFATEKGLEGDVFVKYNVNADGSIVVLQCYSRIPELQKYVCEELNKMNISGKSFEPKQNVVTKISFRLL